MTYQEARKLRNTGLFDLAAQNIASGGGVIGSLGSAISSKFRAKVTGVKEKFDPLNIAKKLTGNFGAAVLGKLTGRSKRDIQYFAGGKKYGSSAGVTQDSNLDAIQPALYTKVAEGQRQRMKKGESVTDVLGKLYNLIKRGYDQDENYRDHDINDKIKKEKRDKKWHKELLEAILGKKTKKSLIKGKISGGDLLNKLLNALDGLKKLAADALTKALEKKAAKEAAKDAAELAAKETEKDVAKATGKELEKDVTKSVTTEASKDVAKATATETGKDVAKATATTVTETAGKTAVKEVSESAIKQAAKEAVAKTVVKSGAESIPLYGAGIGALFAVPRLIQGDFFGAGLEVASGVGGVGTSIAGGVALAVRDVYNHVYKDDSGKLANLESDMIKNPEQTMTRVSKIQDLVVAAGKEAYEIYEKDKKERLQKAIIENKPVVTESAGGAAFLHRGSGLKRSSDNTETPSATPVPSSGSASTSAESMKNYVSRGSTTTPATSASSAPSPSPVGQKVQEVINQNNNLQMESQKPKVINIDNSKNVSMSGGNSGGGLVSDSTVSVRNEDTTLQKTQRQNLRPV